jgi:hypothetical protein
MLARQRPRQPGDAGQARGGARRGLSSAQCAGGTIRVSIAWLVLMPFDISIQTADALYKWGWLGSLAGAFLTAVAVASLIWGTRVRDREAATQLSNANTAASQANVRAATLEVRAAGLENEAAQAKLEQEKLKATLAWRQIPPETASALQAHIAKRQSSVTIAYTGNDPEALFYAIQFSRIFEQAHWKILPESRTYGASIIFNIAIPGPTTADIAFVRDAFHAVGIGFSEDKLPQPVSTVTYGPAQAVTVMYGSKPPPF